MKLFELKKHLGTIATLIFQLPDGSFVPEHFHVTEVGVVDKHFIDCGGTVRQEKKASFQLWNANDVDHRLKPQKLIDIIALSEKVLGMENYEVEVEYQAYTIGKYGLDFNNGHFILTLTQTDCLAKDNCGIPVQKQKIPLTDLSSANQSCCIPGTKCC